MEYVLYFLWYGAGGSWLYWILLIALFIYAKNNRRMIRELSLQLQKPKTQHEVISVSKKIEKNDWGEQVVPKADEVMTSERAGAFSQWLQENWLLKAGALLILLAISWFVNYAFVHDWIGPIGRITLGLGFGTVLLALGTWRIRSYVQQGSIFLFLGSATIMLTTYAARIVYGFFDPLSALTLMFASVSFTSYMAVLYRREQLALVSLVLAYITPLLTAAPVSNTALFTYLLVVAIGSISVAAITGWQYLTPIAIILTGLYSMPYVSGAGDDDRYTLLIFAYLFAALFFITGALSAVHRTLKALKTAQYDIYTPLLNGVFLLLWIRGVVPEVWQSLTFSAWMVVFSVASYIIFKRTGEKHTFYAYAAVGVVYLAAATAAELSGHALTIAYTIEVGALVCLTRLILDNFEATESLAYLFIIPGAMSLPSIGSSAWSVGPIHQDFFVLVIMAIALSLVGIVIKSAYLVKGSANSNTGKTLIIVGTVYGYIIIWLVLHANLFADGLATGISLALYTTFGIGTYLYGQSRSRSDIIRYGSVLICVVIGRLLFIDVWNLELVWRIVVFGLIGVLLMSTAFISKKKN